MGIKIARAGLIAAIYIVLCIALQPLSYGVVQIRFAEALTLLPMLFPEAIPGLFIGALVANLYGPVGMVDVIGGSLTTLVAAYGTYFFRNSVLAYLSPVVLNAIFVSLYLHLFFEWPYWATVLSIGLSEALVVFTLGHLLITVLKRYKRDRNSFLK
ncbi:QueT transporter family protein [Zhaonella formicivorans]|uniref:QueT transporter family protein n=1 Tax=Zhaonella formicivorans TaxID=2528593 RepID=UPI0010DAD647|nr:QueT transporter family protein [Zhaonella formicivorans]